MSSLRINFIMALLLLALLFLQYRLWMGHGGIRDALKLKKTLAVQVATNKLLRVRNDELMTQVAQLQKGQEATESRARNELGMIKKGETFYQIVK